MKYPSPPLYIDQQHKLINELQAIKKQNQLPFACRNGHALKEKPSGGLECQGCGMIFFGYLIKDA